MFRRNGGREYKSPLKYKSHLILNGKELLCIYGKYIYMSTPGYLFELSLFNDWLKLWEMIFILKVDKWTFNDSLGDRFNHLFIPLRLKITRDYN